MPEQELTNTGVDQSGPRPTPPIALTIAGFDPSSGAGITADLKTFAAHGVYGVACISALTVQSTQGVRSVSDVASEIVRQTLDCLADDLPIVGVKVGMLASAQVATEVAAFLKRQVGAARDRIVLDPVLLSSSGAILLDPAGVDVLLTELLGLIGWITPNSVELASLIGSGPLQKEQVPAAVGHLKEIASKAGNRELRVVVTGGHLDRPDDYLLADEHGRWLPGERVETTSTHGTGCAFASSLLCGLIAGQAPLLAAGNAKTFVTTALRSAQPLGKGKGPLNHFFDFPFKGSVSGGGAGP